MYMYTHVYVYVSTVGAETTEYIYFLMHNPRSSDP